MLYHCLPVSPIYLYRGGKELGRHPKNSINPHLSGESSNGVGAATAEARKRTHYEDSFDPRSYNLNTFAVESFGRLG
ncbi:unnamed protein product, partial [Choristocarpus tenellus]